jgi:hypothetical protein
LAEGEKRPFRVVTVLNDPFVMVKRGCNETANGDENDAEPLECQGNGRFEGYCIDLLGLLRLALALGEI